VRLTAARILPTMGVTYNVTGANAQLLAAHGSGPPSFTVHLHAEHWTLNGAPNKFTYTSPPALALLGAIRAGELPPDLLPLLEARAVQFIDGCLLADLLDYRPPKGAPPLTVPARSRHVLRPTEDSRWADVRAFVIKHELDWSDADVQAFEARILVRARPLSARAASPTISLCRRPPPAPSSSTRIRPSSAWSTPSRA
jgi:transcription factor SPT20